MDVRLRVRRFPETRPSELDQLARLARMEVVQGIEAGDLRVLELVRELVVVLGNEVSFGGRDLFERPSEVQKSELARLIEEAFETGQIQPVRSPFGRFSEREFALVDLPPLPPARRDTSGESFFEVRFVDEIGQGLPGLRAAFRVDAESAEVTTNGAGLALLEPARPASGSVALAESETTNLEKLLDERWDKLRPGKAPRESNTTALTFSGAPLPAVFIKPALPNTVVVEPALGKVHLRLVDKRDRVAHANRPYTLSGPVPLAGTTDERGELQHDQLPYADFKLTLQLEEGPVEAGVVVLDPSAPIQTRRLGVVPYVELAELRGLFFATNKSFLLPATVTVFERVRRAYERNTPSELLIVGHTDTTAEATINDPLSLERAQNTLAYLKDDVEAWLKMYETKIPEGRRWGAEEDEAMIVSMPDAESILPGEELVRWFQRTRNLEVDGVAGPKTRGQLIKEYMSLDGVSLSDPGFEIEATVHGAGENFPLDSDQQDVEASAADEVEDQGDRRVELFFFDPDFGIQPPPPGENSKSGDTQYLKWREAVARHELADTAAETVKVRCADELGQPLAGLTFRLETSDGRTFSGALDADGSARVFVATAEPCRFFASGIDEASLGVSTAVLDDDTTTAATLASTGTEVSPGALAIVRVGLGELLVTTDGDEDDLDSVRLTLQSSDGAFSQTLAAAADGVPSSGGLDLTFRGLPTLDKTYKLNVSHGDGDDTIFDGVTFAELTGISNELKLAQIEPTRGGEDGRISRNEGEDASGDELGTATV